MKSSTWNENSFVNRQKMVSSLNNLKFLGSHLVIGKISPEMFFGFRHIFYAVHSMCFSVFTYLKGKISAWIVYDLITAELIPISIERRWFRVKFQSFITDNLVETNSIKLFSWLISFEWMHTAVALIDLQNLFEVILHKIRKFLQAYFLFGEFFLSGQKVSWFSAWSCKTSVQKQK